MSKHSFARIGQVICLGQHSRLIHSSRDPPGYVNNACPHMFVSKATNICENKLQERQGCESGQSMAHQR